MPSPFPGMNPYLERRAMWSDFHAGFCQALKDELVPQVRPEFYVKFNENVYVHEKFEERRLAGRSDVSISRNAALDNGQGGVGGLEAPVAVRIEGVLEDERQPFLEVFDSTYHALITVIEMLSPTNKYAGKDRNQFLDKRLQILISSAHYVEIDLLRGGPRLPIENLPDCDYYALVSRAEARPDMGLWPVDLRDPLPTIPIPLQEPKPDAQINLQELLHRIYDKADYGNYIYSGEPEPQLRRTDAEWAKEIIKTNQQ